MGIFGSFSKSENNTSENKNLSGVFSNYGKDKRTVNWNDVEGKPDFSTLSGVWGSITGTVTDQTDLVSWVNGLLNNYVTSSNLTTTLNNYVTNTLLSSTLSGYATTTALTTGLSTKQDALSGTGFVKISGTIISYDNSNYVTSSSLSSTLSNYFLKSGDTLVSTNNTNNTGYIGIPAQQGTGTVSAPSSGFRLYATSTNAFAWVGQNGYRRIFDGTTNTADQTYTLPNVSGTLPIGTGTTNYITYWSGTNTIAALALDADVQFGTTNLTKTITSGGGSPPYYTTMFQINRSGGNGLSWQVIESTTSTWDSIGTYSTFSNTLFGTVSGGTRYTALGITGSTTPYVWIGYNSNIGTPTIDSGGSRVWLAVNGGIAISSASGGVYSNTSTAAVYATTGLGSLAGDLVLAARNVSNGTSTGSEIQLATNATRRIAIAYNGFTQFYGATQYPVTNKSGTYTLTDTDMAIRVTASTTITLPDVVTSATSLTRNVGRIYVITNTSAGNVTISRNTAGSVINQGTAANTYTLATTKTAIIQAFDDSNWYILSVY